MTPQYEFDRVNALSHAITTVYPKDHMAYLIAELAVTLEIGDVPVPNNTRDCVLFQ